MAIKTSINEVMNDDGDFPDILDFYASDISQYPDLTSDQDIWLALAINAKGKLFEILKDKKPSTRQDLEIVFIGILGQFVTILEDLLSQRQSLNDNDNSTIDDFISLFQDAIIFRNTNIPPKNSVIDNLLDTSPKSAHRLLFDLALCSLLLPSSVIKFYPEYLTKERRYPTISIILDAYNPINNVEEIKAVIDLSKSSRDMLINSNLRYVKFYAYKYRNAGIDFADILQAGNIGLIKAVDKFDVYREVQLRTLAIWWIKQSIIRSINDNNRVIRLPVHVQDSIQKIQIKYRQYIKCYNQKPSIDKLAELCDIHEDKLRELIRLLDPIISISSLIRCEDNLSKSLLAQNSHCFPLCLGCDQFSWRDLNSTDMVIVPEGLPICEDPAFKNPFSERIDRISFFLNVLKRKEKKDRIDIIYNNQLRSIINEGFKELSDRERTIIEYRYGFVDGEAKTLAQVGELLNVTRERIRQIEYRAKEKLKGELSTKIKGYIEF